MENGLFLIFVLMIIAAGVYIYRVIYHARQVMPRAPNLLMQDVWNNLMEKKDQLGEHERRVVDLVQRKFSDTAIQEIHEELLDVEEKLKAATDPLALSRTTIMDAVDVYVFNEAILNLDDEARKKVQTKLGNEFDDVNLVGAFLRSEFICLALRTYSSAKYSDVAQEDWFTCYVQSAKGCAENTIAMFKTQIEGQNPWFEVRLYEIYQPLMNRLRQTLLKAPRQTPIREPEGASNL
jgi:hypothetical protein